MVQHATIQLTEDEKAILRPARRLDIAAWAEEHMNVVDGPLVQDGGEPSRWDPAAFPLQRTIIEAIGDDRWAKVFLMTGPQAFGKTQCAALPTILYALQHRGVSAAYVTANLNLGVTQWRRKIEPAIMADPALRGLLHDNPDLGGSKSRRDFTNGTSLHCAGADSVGALSGFTVPVIVCDDLQAYPATLPGFGHPADVAWKRAEAFPADQVTLIGIGTAGTVDDYLWKSMAASALYCPFVPCLTCGTYQLLEWNRLVFPEDDPQAATEHTVMGCAGTDCDHPIVFDELHEMLEQNLWVSCPPGEDWVTAPTEGGVTIDVETASTYPDTRRNTNEAGFWCNALYWPLGKTWGQRAADFLGLRGEPDRVKDHQQTICVVPYKEPEIDEERLTQEEIAGHLTDGYAAGTVPVAADVVTITVDVQSGYVYYIVRAWRKSDGTSWLIDLKTVGRPLKGIKTQAETRRQRFMGIGTALDEVDAMIRQGYPHVKPDGEIVGTIQVARGLIDRGYEKDTVAGWCWAKHRGVWSTILGQKAGQTAALWPIKAQRDKRNRPYRTVDVAQAKHVVRRLLRIAKGGAGYWHMPAQGINPQTIRAYYRHMASEQFNRQRDIHRWEKVEGVGANHFWDCEVYHVSAALACGVQLVGMPTVQKRAAQTDYFAKQGKRPRGVLTRTVGR